MYLRYSDMLFTLDVIARQSKDPSTKVAAALFTARGRLLGLAYNDLPPELDTPEHWANTRFRRGHARHAEAQLLENKSLALTRGGLLISNYIPCSKCAKRIVMARIARVVCGKADPAREARWHIEETRRLFLAGNVELMEITRARP